MISPCSSNPTTYIDLLYASMSIVSSTYLNMFHMNQNLEKLQTMRNIGTQIAILYAKNDTKQY